MPFGFTNILVICQQFVNNIFIKYLDIFIIVYLNNILIYLKIFKEYIKYVKIVFGKLALRKFIVKKMRFL